LIRLKKGAASLPYRRRSAPKVDGFRLDGGLKREGAGRRFPKVSPAAPKRGGVAGAAFVFVIH